MTSGNDRKPYSPAMLAARWGCSMPHVYNLLNSGELVGFRLGKLWRISADAVEAFEGAAAASDRLSVANDPDALHDLPTGPRREPMDPRAITRMIRRF